MSTIHVIEDNQDISDIIVYLLEECGYTVQTSATAKAFNLFMITHHPDLILMDVMLPDGDGKELCYNVKTNIETNDIPVIIMSAHVLQTNLSGVGCADDFISKPFDIYDFIIRIKKHLAA